MTVSVKNRSGSGRTSRLDALRVQLMTGRKTSGVGQRIRQRRLQRGLKQRELAKRLDMEPPRLSEYENDVHHPSPETMEAIANELRTPVAWFYEKDGEPPDLMAEIARRIEARMDNVDAQLAALLRRQGLDPADFKSELPPLRPELRPPDSAP